MPYLTPDEIPEDTQCGVLLIPNDRAIIAAVLGALYDLTLPENWELFGVVTPDEIAAAMDVMYETFLEECPEVTGESVPIGSIQAWVGASGAIPSKWFACEGTLVLKADYPDLYDVIGNQFTYGGEDATHFHMPDMRGRILIGDGSDVGIVGVSDGSLTHTLSVGEMPSHAHVEVGTLTGGGQSNQMIRQASAGGSSVTLPSNNSTSVTGGGAVFSILNPVTVIRWIIKALP